MLAALSLAGLFAVSAAALPTDHAALAQAPQLLPVRAVGPAAIHGPRIQRDIERPRSASPDSMQLLTQIYSVLNDALVLGDTDHDGLNEAILSATFGPTFDYRILELQGDGSYLEVFVGPYFNPYASGDFDNDGNAEILGQPGNFLVVYESLSPISHPSVVSWQSPPLTNIIGYPTAADTDGDGWMEIIHSINTFGTSRIVIYENTGDNAFSQVFYQLQSPQDGGRKVVADLDGDGRSEIAHCGTYGYLHVYESPADNVWQQTFFDSTGLGNAYAVAGGVDTDGNGRVELFVTGDSQQTPGERRTFVYEAPSDNNFCRVAVLPYYDAHIGGSHSCVANLDASGREEFVLKVFPQQRGGLLIYRSFAPGQWTIAFTIPNPDPEGDHAAVFPFDANRNGRPELFWVENGNANFGRTWVFEHLGVSPADTPPDFTSTVAHLMVLPNPCRTEAAVLLTVRSRTTAAQISTFDASGRLVARSSVQGGNRLSWSPLELQPGIYFLRLDDPGGLPLARGRVTVVR